MGMLGIKGFSFVLLMLLVLASGTLGSAQVQNGNFASAGTDWTLTPAASGSDFHYGSMYSTTVAAFGGVSTGYYDTISQTLPTQSGYGYTLTFELANADLTADGNFEAIWNGNTVVDVLGPDPTDNNALTPYSVTVAATGSSSTLSFAGYQVPSWYFLTDVSVTSNGPLSAPEGGSTLLYLLLAAAVSFGAMWFVYHRRLGSSIQA